MPKYVLLINLTYNRLKNNDNCAKVNDITIFNKNHLQQGCASDFIYDTFLN